jgi:hypothetical protein
MVARHRKGDEHMSNLTQDVIYIGVIVAFFAICVAYVRGLDRLVKATEQAESDIASEVTS